MVRNVIVEVRPNATLADAGAMMMLNTKTLAPEAVAAAPTLPGFQPDPGFTPVPLPTLFEIPGGMSLGTMGIESFDISDDPDMNTYLLRGTVDDNDLESVTAAAEAHPEIVGVFADVAIDVCTLCPGAGPMGTDTDVERLLCVPQLRAKGMDGTGTLVAIVDTGFNMAYLNAHGKHPTFDAARSWVPAGGGTPGSQPVDHGTMCAFDVCIAAPNATLLDISLLRSSRSGGSVMDGLLSDGVLAYRHLLNIMLAPRRPGESRSLVVSNSWGMFNPSWDFPVGHPGNYSDNPNHPFSRIVASLARAGADILFAAGNCGRDCPDGRCGGVTSNVIYGANSHPQVLSVAGVDITGTRVGYSSIGPGRLTRRKPDISGFTHFRGSGVYAADGGTSAATPVVSGVVAAVRSRLPYVPGNVATYPARIRQMVRATAFDRGAIGYDFEYGWGIINGCQLSRRVPLTTNDATFENLLEAITGESANANEWPLIPIEGGTSEENTDDYVLVGVEPMAQPNGKIPVSAGK